MLACFLMGVFGEDACAAPEASSNHCASAMLQVQNNLSDTGYQRVASYSKRSLVEDEGNKLKDIADTSFDTCVSECNNKKGCLSFSLCKSDQKISCRLSDKAVTMAAKAKARKGGEAGSCWTYYVDTMYSMRSLVAHEGNNLADKTPLESVASCAKECNHKTGCQSFTWCYPDCHLKDGVTSGDEKAKQGYVGSCRTYYVDTGYIQDSLVYDEGNNLADLKPVENVASCAKACNDNKDCQSFSLCDWRWKQEGISCHLKDKRVTAGAKTKNNGNQKYCSTYFKR